MIESQFGFLLDAFAIKQLECDADIEHDCCHDIVVVCFMLGANQDDVAVNEPLDNHCITPDRDVASPLYPHKTRIF